MNPSIQSKMTVPTIRNSVRHSPIRRVLPLIPLVFVCLGLLPAPNAFGVVPAPDGGYPNQNTAEGTDALFSLTTGFNNTAIGFDALFSNTVGVQNTAAGTSALFSNTNGSENTAVGHQALFSNTNGTFNTAAGFSALSQNTTGSSNTATGVFALGSNSTGVGNTANGFEALVFNTTGSDNTATGSTALFNNTTGGNNTAIGLEALFSNTTGSDNIAVGFQAGFNLTTGDSNIDIGNEGVSGEANTIRIGRRPSRIFPQGQTATFIAGIIGAPIAGPTVHISGSGQLGVPPSSARFKADIKPMDKASEAIHALKPVTFRYKQELDPEGIPQFGLVAEEVEKVNPNLVARDDQGKVYTVRYDAVNAMLLNEFLKEHRRVEQQEATISRLKSTVAKQEATAARHQKQIEVLTTGLQKMSDQLELSRTAPRMVLNNQ